MTMIHCDIKDCENNEDGLCHAAAVRISIQECCLTYHPHDTGKYRTDSEMGDKLTWDKEYFEDDPLDDDFTF